MTIINGNYRELELDNGLRVMLQNTPTQTINGRLRIFFGSLNENPGEEGLAHLLEHNLLFGGSSKYSPEESDKIKSKFGYYNAFSKLDGTTFPVDMIAEDLELYLNYISDIAFRPLFDQTRFEEERNRVFREISDDKSKPSFKDNKEFNDSIFRINSPQNYYILGNESVISSATPELIRDFHSRGYGAANMDLILVGALPDNAEEIIRKNFSDKNKGNNTKFKFQRNLPIESKVVYHTSAPDLYNSDNPEESNAEISIASYSPNITNQDFYAFQMLDGIFGGDEHSRLFKRVSQRMSLAYWINSNNFYQNNSGILYTSGSILASKSDEVINAIFDEMSDLRKNLVSNNELDRAKRASKYQIAKLFESNSGHLEAIELMVDHGITIDSFSEKFGVLTPKDVQEVAHKYFPDSRENGKYVLMLRDPLKK